MDFKIGDIVKHTDWDELGIVVACQPIQFSDEVYIIVQWTTGRRGFWRTDGAKKYLTIVG